MIGNLVARFLRWLFDDAIPHRHYDAEADPPARATLALLAVGILVLAALLVAASRWSTL